MLSDRPLWRTDWKLRRPLRKRRPLSDLSGDRHRMLAVLEPPLSQMAERQWAPVARVSRRHSHCAIARANVRR